MSPAGAPGAGGPIEGRVVRLGDDVNTDLVLPGPYLNLTDPAELGRHLLEGYDRELGASIRPGDVLVAGENFGCGSSREQAPVAILARGVGAVLAASFARIFLRNAMNLALPVVESREAVAAVADGETIRIDLHAGVVETQSGARFEVPAQPPFVDELRGAGGLTPWVQRRLRERG